MRKSFRVSARVELPDWACQSLRSLVDLSWITADCVLHVSDPDGELDSWLIDLSACDGIRLEDSDDQSRVMTVEQFCQQANCSRWRVEELFMRGTTATSENLHELAQHLWIYSADALRYHSPE